MNVIQRELAAIQDSIDGINKEGMDDQQSLQESLGLENNEKLDLGIDLEQHDGDESQEVEEEPKRVKSQRTENRRIKELTQKLKNAEEEKNRYAEQAYEKDLLLQQQYHLIQERDQKSFKQQEQTLKNQIASAQKEWQWAYDSGDSEKLAEAATTLAYYTSEFVNVKKDSQKYEANPVPYQTQRAVDPIPPSNRTPGYASQIEDWIEDNSWYDTNTPDFNPSLRKAVDQYATDVLNKYFAPDDPRYIQYLNDYVAKNLSPSGEGSSNRQPQMRRSQQMVAPVNKSPVSGGGKTNPIDKIVASLTPREKEAALSMIYSNNEINADPDKKIRKYAEGRLADMRIQREQQKAQMMGGYSL